MGGELSKLPPAEKAALEEAARKQVDDDIEKYAELYKQQHREHKRKKPSTEGALSKNHPSTDLEPPSDSNAMPMRSANSSQTPAANDLLASFKPRKEKETKTTSSSEQHSKSASQANASPNSIQVASKTPKVTSKGSSPANYSTTAATTSKRSAPDDNTKEPKPISLSALSSIGKIQKRTSVASPQSPDRIEDVSATMGDQRPPRWYRDLQVLTTRNKHDAAVDPLLASLRDLATNAKDLKAPQDRQELHMLFEKVRPKLHIIAFQLVSPQVLKRNRMLHNTSGLPQIFDDRYNSGVQWPFDIKADANELYNKWYKKIFETDMMRGIKFSLKGTKKEGGDSIDPNYKDVVPAKVHGQNGLVNGQWWPFQICALRDGAHGSIQGGISGSKDKGAFSCILSGGTDSKGQIYPDVDEGDVVFYCGTDSEDGDVTAYTKRMLESVNNQPVRLIRSHNAHSEYRPAQGFRYDGLYNVTEVEHMDPEDSIRQRHRFKLVRVAGQDPIRGGDGPEKRPTREEIKEFLNHQRLSGKGQSKT